MDTKRGFTIVEVLVALAIVAIAIAILSNFSNIFAFTSSASNSTIAQTFGRSYLDALRGLWAVKPNYNGTVLYASSALPSPLPSGYSYTVSVYDETGATLVRSYSSGSGSNPSTPINNPNNLSTVVLTILTPRNIQLKLSTQIVRPIN